MKESVKHYFDRLNFHIGFLVRGHILNPLWHSRDVRRHKRLEATSQTVNKYLSRYSDEISKICPPVPNNTAKEPERAFAIWLQGEDNAPDSIKACIKSMRRHLDCRLEVLDENSLFDWISLPDYIIDKWKTGKMSNAHFSDICRIELLFQHGGYWFDATDYVTDGVPDLIKDSDFFVFMAGRKIKSWIGYIQNCFIRAKKGNQLIGLWREAIFEYWKKENSVINYYVHQMLFKLLVETNNTAKRLFAEMPRIDQDPTHVLWYDHRNDPYDKVLYEKYTSPTFFQKTNFKDENARNPIPMTMAAYIFSTEK